MAEEQMELVAERLHAIRGDIDNMKHMFDAADRCLGQIETTLTDIQSMRSRK